MMYNNFKGDILIKDIKVCPIDDHSTVGTSNINITSYNIHSNNISSNIFKNIPINVVYSK